MGFGPSQAELDSQKMTQQYMSDIPKYLDQSGQWMNQGFGQLQGVNNQINSYLAGVGKDPTSLYLQDYTRGMLSGQNRASQAQMGMLAQAGLSSGALARADQAAATNVAMQGKTFAQQFGSDLGGLALQQKNMQSVADKLASTTDNPFAVNTRMAMEDAAMQNAQGMSQLRSQLGAQGLDATSGTGAAALAALQFNTNKQVADAARQNAVQGAQFQQQGLGMAGNLYNQLAGLDLQRATTGAQLGLQGYQTDISNAARMDQVGMSNAQLATQANIASAQNQTQSSIANADALTRASIANAQNSNNINLANAQADNTWKLAGLQGLSQQLQGRDQAILQAYGLLSGNAGQYLNAGSNMWGGAMNAYGQGVGMMNQNAMANAQGRGNFWGGLLQGGMGLAGSAMLSGLLI